MSKFASIQKIYHSIVPARLRKLLLPFLTTLHRKVLLKKIIQYLSSKGDKLNKEEKDVLLYLKQNGLSVFPGHFQDKYLNVPVEVMSDRGSGLKYVLHGDKKLFFKRDMTTEKIIKMYRGICIEQDINSPHRYLTKDFSISPNSVLAEAGAAEASFSLDATALCKKIYIFENDPLWVEALEHTFKPWLDKVTIINSFVSSGSAENQISLDDFFNECEKPDFIKIDVDGEEMNLLKGFDRFLSDPNNRPKIAICTYHNQSDESEFKSFFSSRGFRHQTSDGYMIFIFDSNLTKPYLRRGILRAFRPSTPEII